MSFQETHAYRTDEKKRMDENLERMVSTLLKDFPCLEYGEYILEEMRITLGKGEKEMEEILRRGKTALEILVTLTPKAKLQGHVSVIYVTLKFRPTVCNCI